MEWKFPLQVTDWVRLLNTHSGPAWPVHEVELVASHLAEGLSKRPRYERVAAFPLS